MLLSRIHGFVCFFSNIQKRTVLIPVIFRHARRHGFSDPDLRAVFRNGIDLIQQIIPPVIVFPGQNDNELISPYSEYRTVAENPADFYTGIPYTYIPFFMPIQIVDCFQIIDIANHDCKRFLCPLINSLIYYLFPLHIGIFVFDSCQGIDGRHFSGGWEISCIFLFLPHLRVFIEQADDQQRFSVFLNLCCTQSHISRKLVVQQAVVQDKHPVPLNSRKDVLFADLCMKHGQVFRMNRLQAVLICFFEEISSMICNSKILVAPWRAELCVLSRFRVNIIQYNQVSVQSGKAQI